VSFLHSAAFELDDLLSSILVQVYDLSLAGLLPLPMSSMGSPPIDVSFFSANNSGALLVAVGGCWWLPTHQCQMHSPLQRKSSFYTKASRCVGFCEGHSAFYRLRQNRTCLPVVSHSICRVSRDPTAPAPVP
jgi:hypothetical protein